MNNSDRNHFLRKADREIEREELKLLEMQIREVEVRQALEMEEDSEREMHWLACLFEIRNEIRHQDERVSRAKKNKKKFKKWD